MSTESTVLIHSRYSFVAAEVKVYKYNKHLMSGPSRNQLVLFSLESGKQNQLFPSGSDIKCITL